MAELENEVHTAEIHAILSYRCYVPQKYLLFCVRFHFFCGVLKSFLWDLCSDNLMLVNLKQKSDYLNLYVIFNLYKIEENILRN